MDCLITRPINKTCDTQVSGLKKIEIQNIEQKFGTVVNEWYDIPFYSGTGSFGVNAVSVNPDLKHFHHTVSGSFSMYQQDFDAFKEYSLATVRFRITDNNDNVYIVCSEGAIATQFEYNTGAAATDLVGVTFTFECDQKEGLIIPDNISFYVSDEETEELLITDDYEIYGLNPFRIEGDLFVDVTSISDPFVAITNTSNDEFNLFKMEAVLHSGNYYKMICSMYNNALRIEFPDNISNKNIHYVIDYYPGRDLKVSIIDNEYGSETIGVFKDAVLSYSIKVSIGSSAREGYNKGTIIRSDNTGINMYQGDGEYEDEENPGYFSGFTLPTDRPWSLNFYVSIQKDQTSGINFNAVDGEGTEFLFTKELNTSRMNLTSPDVYGQINVSLGDTSVYGPDSDHIICMNYYPNAQNGLRITYTKNGASILRNAEIEYDIDNIIFDEECSDMDTFIYIADSDVTGADFMPDYSGMIIATVPAKRIAPAKAPVIKEETETSDKTETA